MSEWLQDEANRDFVHKGLVDSYKVIQCAHGWCK